MFCFKYYLVVLFLSFAIAALSQPEDSTFIADYARRNDIEVYNAFNSTRLRFYTSGKEQDALNFFSNDGLFSGIYLGYKWLNIGYGINVPFTSRDNAVKGFKAYRLHLKGYYHGWGVSGSSHIYKGLLSQTYKGNYTPIDGVKYTSISADFFHVINSARYSYKAAQYLGQQQLQSCGSFLYHVRPSYYALGLQTSPTPVSDSIKQAISGNPRWFSLVASVAYGYNFVWDKGKWIVSPYAEAGIGGLYQFGIQQKVRAAGLFRAALVAGYSTEKAYTYISAETINSTNILASSILSDDRLLISVTTGIHIPGLKKKILGLL